MITDGAEYQSFLARQNLDLESLETLAKSTVKILERTELLDGENSQNCQLVIGEVQSGKTMSFTSLIALAHDNGFPVVIVLAGTKIPLLEQTKARLRTDLRADGDGGANPWIMTPKLTKKSRSEVLVDVQKNLLTWTQMDAPDKFKPTIIATSLKNRESLDEVTHLVSNLKSGFDIAEFPVLIIDDEGDQAGLNLRWQDDEESPVYAAIQRLRNSLPRHSYVMYTATPQGPLLINIQDAMSPKYVTVLRSGRDYLGGIDLFHVNSQFVKEIPNLEHDSVFSSDIDASVPNSLKHALAFYLLTLYAAQNRNLPKPISMLIHPSFKISLHERYKNWVEEVVKAWQLILTNPEESIYQSEKSKFFEVAQAELAKTFPKAANWNLDEVLSEIRWWINKIKVRIVNSKADSIQAHEWKSNAGWIVIGGNSLERGFTVENLAVTYMPRSQGEGNVDVIQQRGRFFGYKRSYQDLLRAWFFRDKAQAFFDYVAHENSIREQLLEIDRSNGKLSDWRRKFLLDPSYNAVRREVVSMGIFHRSLSTFKQQTLYYPGLHEHQDSFLERIYSLATGLVEMPSDRRNNPRNFSSRISLDSALELLTDWPMAPDNRTELDDMIWALRMIADDGEINDAAVVLMDWNEARGLQHVRSRSMLHDRPNPKLPIEGQRIANLWQGPSSNLGETYPGDSKMIVPDCITLQVHRVRPMYMGNPRPDVVALALIIPYENRGFLAQAFERSFDL